MSHGCLTSLRVVIAAPARPGQKPVSLWIVFSFDKHLVGRISINNPLLYGLLSPVVPLVDF